jgi:hypothetical protein
MHDIRHGRKGWRQSLLNIGQRGWCENSRQRRDSNGAATGCSISGSSRSVAYSADGQPFRILGRCWSDCRALPSEKIKPDWELRRCKSITYGRKTGSS